MVKGLSAGAVAITTIGVRRFEVMLAINALQGAGDGLVYGPYTSLIQSLVGSERFSFALSISLCTTAIPVFAGSPLAGLALDLSKNYCTFL